MRTNIDIDDDLLRKAMKATGTKTKKAAVEEGLRRIVEGAEAYKLLKQLQGTVEFEDGYNETYKAMRAGTTSDPR